MRHVHLADEHGRGGERGARVTRRKRRPRTLLRNPWPGLYSSASPGDANGRVRPTAPFITAVRPPLTTTARMTSRPVLVDEPVARDRVPPHTAWHRARWARVRRSCFRRPSRGPSPRDSRAAAFQSSRRESNSDTATAAPSAPVAIARVLRPNSGRLVGPDVTTSDGRTESPDAPAVPVNVCCAPLRAAVVVMMRRNSVMMARTDILVPGSRKLRGEAELVMNAALPVSGINRTGAEGNSSGPCSTWPPNDFTRSAASSVLYFVANRYQYWPACCGSTGR